MPQANKAKEAADKIEACELEIRSIVRAADAHYLEAQPVESSGEGDGGAAVGSLVKTVEEEYAKAKEILKSANLKNENVKVVFQDFAKTLCQYKGISGVGQFTATYETIFK